MTRAAELSLDLDGSYGIDTRSGCGGPPRGEQSEDIDRSRFHPEVALIDIGMPDLNGYELARQIRSEPWWRHVALVTVSDGGWSGKFPV